LGYWGIGVLGVGYWVLGIGYWGIGVLGVGYWGIGVLGYWGIGVLGYWGIGCWVLGCFLKTKDTTFLAYFKVLSF
jgi:hypothetical protein